MLQTLVVYMKRVLCNKRGLYKEFYCMVTQNLCFIDLNYLLTISSLRQKQLLEKIRSKTSRVRELKQNNIRSRPIRLVVVQVWRSAVQRRDTHTSAPQT